MSRGRSSARDNTSMNLFPFLAVLICTMGSLIVLLVVMVQQAQVRAGVATVEVTQPPQLEDNSIIEQRKLDRQQQLELANQKQEEIEQFQWETSLLKESYAKTTEDLKDQRLRLSHLEDHARELTEKATRMQAEADAIARLTASQSRDEQAAKNRISELDTLIASAGTEVEAERKKIGQRRKTYALIPYDGPHATRRRPIYIECLADRVIIQPEGVVLTGDDFQEPLTISNPLAAALRAKREFLLRRGLLEKGQEPYPLLVVRPHSAAAYAAARGAMKAWEAEFGYELVEEEIELDYPIADPSCVTLLEDVVAEARDKRQLLRAMQTRQRQRTKPGLLRPSSKGGFEPVDGGSSVLPGSGRGDHDGTGGHMEHGGRRATSGSDNPFGDDATGNGDSGNSSRRDSGSSRYDQDGKGGGSRFGELGSYNSSSDHDLGGGRGGGADRQSSRDGNVDGTSTSPGAKDGRANNLANGTPGNPGQNGNESGQTSEGAAAGRQQGESSGTAGRGTSGAGGGSSGTSQATDSAGGAAQFSNMQSLAGTRGSNWALPDANTTSIGIRRPLRVVIDPHRIVLVPEKGSQEELQIFTHDGDLQAVIDPFVNTIRARLKSWGIAGRGLYWEPVLQVEVKNADNGYQQLLRLLDSSGVQVTRQP